MCCIFSLSHELWPLLSHAEHCYQTQLWECLHTAACQKAGQKNHAQTQDKVPIADVYWDRQREIQNTGRDPENQVISPKSKSTESESK